MMVPVRGSPGPALAGSIAQLEAGTMSVARSLIGILLMLAVVADLARAPAQAAPARTKRIVVVGDSWAGLMALASTGGLLQSRLDQHGFAGVEVVATLETAMPGSRASDWASNQGGRMDTLKKILA